MADTATTEMPRAQKSKLALADLGNPTLVKNMSPEEKAKNNGRYFVGTIFGRAAGITSRSDPKGEQTFEGLTGEFATAPSSANFTPLESGVLFLPDAFHTMIAAPLSRAQEKDKAAVIEFVMECYTVEAKNPIGYSWQLQPAFPMTDKHPLGDLMAKYAALPASKQRAIAGPAKK